MANKASLKKSTANLAKSGDVKKKALCVLFCAGEKGGEKDPLWVAEAFPKAKRPVYTRPEESPKKRRMGKEKKAFFPARPAGPYKGPRRFAA